MSNDSQRSRDYLRPVRAAARTIAGEDQGQYDALISFAGAILDAVRAEAELALYDRNIKAIEDELARAPISHTPSIQCKSKGRHEPHHYIAAVASGSPGPVPSLACLCPGVQ